MILDRQYYKIVFFFALLASLFAVLQSLRVTPLVDYAYQIENAYRIYRGEMPYRDFFLVLPPGTYLLTALSMIPTGGFSHSGHMILIVLQTFTAVVLLGYILAKVGNDRVLALIVLILTLATGHVIYPWASYDLDAVLCILLSLALWFHVLNKKNVFTCFILGIFFSLPTYFKQNIGFVYVVSILFLYMLAFLRFRKREIFLEMIGIGLGVGMSYSLFFLWLATNGIIEAFVYQTLIFPGRVKQPLVAVSNMIGAYREYANVLLNNYGYIGILLLPHIMGAFAKRYRTHLAIIGSIPLLVLIFRTVFAEGEKFFYYPFLVAWSTLYVLTFITSGIYFFRAKTKQEFFSFLFPIACVAACHATYLSHHPVNATYGIWSLFILIMFPVISAIRSFFTYIPIRFFTVSIVTCLLILLARYNAEFGFFGSIDVSMSWGKDMERIIAYSEKYIPKTDRVAFFPGEDPFFAITKRKNPLSFVQFQMGTYPMFEKNMLQELLDAGVEWIIVKEETQLLPGFGLVYITDPMFGLDREYIVVERIPRYSIWRKKS